MVAICWEWIRRLNLITHAWNYTYNLYVTVRIYSVDGVQSGRDRASPVRVPGSDPGMAAYLSPAVTFGIVESVHASHEEDRGSIPSRAAFL
jgi:hypothetical protein